MEIKNDTIYQIKTKVVLYKNKKYFPIFRNIFITNTLNYLLSKNKSHITSNQKIKNIKAQNNEIFSLWNIIIKNIEKKTEIIDYDLNNYKSEKKEENEEIDEDDNFLQFLMSQYKVIQINNLVFAYLNKICMTKLHKLILISNKDKIPLINLMKIYLGFCSQYFAKNKTKKVEINEVRNSPASLTKKLSQKFSTNEKIVNLNEDNNNNKTRKILKLKSNETYKRNLSIEQSKVEEENNKEKNDLNSDYDNMINEQIQKSLNKLNSKNKNINSKILYSSSIARLFIGETDKESIREKYLSNFEKKKEKKLKKNKGKNLSSIFYKVFLTRLEQNKKNKLPLMERGIENILIKFQKNQEIIDKFMRLKNRHANRFSFYDGHKTFNKTTVHKKEKINYLRNNSKFNNLGNKKKKIRIIYDYNYNLKNYLNMKNNPSKQIKENEFMKKKNNIKKKLIKRQNENDNDNEIAVLKENLTAKAKKSINDIYLKYNIVKEENEELNNNVINYITKNDLFFDNL